MEPELEALDFSIQMTTLDKAISEENTKLDELLHERVEATKAQEKEKAQEKHKAEPKSNFLAPPGATSKDKKKKKETKKT